MKPINYKYVIQFKNNNKWFVTAQATTIKSSKKFISESKKQFTYEYRYITFEQYEREKIK